MNAVFRYKLKIIPALVLFVLCGAFVFVFCLKGWMNRIIVVCVICAALEAVVILYYLSKRLVLNEEGISVRVFWALTVADVRWENMDEAFLTARHLAGGPGETRTFDIASMPGGWVVDPAGPPEKAKANLLRILMKDADPFFVDLRALKDGSRLPDLVARRIDFIK